MNMPHGFSRLGSNAVVIDCSESDFWWSLIMRLAKPEIPNLFGQFCGISWFSGLLTLADAGKIKRFPQEYSEDIGYISFYVESQLVILFDYIDHENYPEWRRMLLMGSSNYALTKLRMAADIYMNSEDR